MLFILRYLMRHTSDQKMLPIADIRSICEENGYGMPARNKVTNDLKTLIEAGFDIEYETINRVNYYYYAGYTVTNLQIFFHSLKYYVQIRTYTKKNGTTFYSKWSTMKSVKTR